MPAEQCQMTGCVMGLAVGDAVASPYEGLVPGMIFDFGPADKIVEHASSETIYYTDDTQMTISILQELNEGEGIDEDRLAARFAENYHPDRGYGQGARKIINAIGFNEDWREAASTIFNGEGSLGNGAAMRVAPIGVFYCDDLNHVADQAARSARPTHQHPIGIDAARLLAIAVALASNSRGMTLRRNVFLESLKPWAQTEEFRWQISLALQLQPFESLVSFGNSLEAHRSVMTSILCFADSPNDYCQAISRAIGQGDDVDTLAAMTGGIAGARLGLEAVPQRLIDCLENGHQGRSFLLDLAVQAHKRSVAVS